MDLVSGNLRITRLVAAGPRCGLAALAAFLVCAPAKAASDSDEPSPFRVVPSTAVSNGVSQLALSFHIPEQHHLYADRVAVELNGVRAPIVLPAGRRIVDRFSKGERQVFEQDFQILCPLPRAGSAGAPLAVSFQGCSETECYFPETHRWLIREDHSIAAVEEDAGGGAPAAAGPGLIGGFRVAARASGFLDAGGFMKFLDGTNGGAAAAADLPFDAARIGMVAALGLILVGGLALNLTPCVLPMIPINLAILGVGSKNGNRRRGFWMGIAYGSGMALAYGALGLAVVLTGSKFGALNASPWFNAIIAVVFVALGLAMFDKLAIDLSRFQPSGGKPGSSKGAFLGAGIMGAVSALLAGACVAPVVISVLLFATTLYQQGNWLGLSLPFVLGLGMALPWPFAGAGLSFLPKPGAWMTRVKHGFGVIIFAFAAWYGWLGLSLSGLGHGGPALVSARSQDLQALHAALDQGRATGKPVVVDFWASWCKNCEAMEHSTFRSAAVRQRLDKDFIFVKFQAERLSDSTLKPVLDSFGVIGLPSYVVLVADPNGAVGSKVTVSSTQ